MMSQDLEMTKNGITVPVRVNTVFNGQFEATVGDERMSAATWPELEKLVDRATKRIAREVSIPFTRLVPGINHKTHEIKVQVAHGIATGLHSSNGNVLSKINGQSVQFSPWESRQGEVYRTLSPEEIKEYRSLQQTLEDASNAVREWKQSRKLDLKEEVVKILNEGAAPTQ